MDDQMMLKQKMNSEQIQQYAKNTLMKETAIEEYLLEGEQKLNLSAEQLHQLYGRKDRVLSVNPAADMPTMDAEKKEWKQKRRQKNQLKAQAKELKRSHISQVESFQNRSERLKAGERPDAQAVDMFEKVIDFTKLSPKYVLEHFVEVRQMLDSWKEHITLFGAGGVGSNVMTLEQKLKLPELQRMYEQSEQAFQSALAAMGYKYQESEKGGGSFLENLTEEQKADALKENIRLRRDIAQSEKNIDEKVEEQLINSEQKLLHTDIEEMQKDMKADPKFAFIESEHLSNLYQYEEIEKLKSMIASFPQQYGEHKAQIDRMYEEFFHLMEVNGTYQEPATAITSIQFDQQKVSSKKMQKRLQATLDSYTEKMRIIRNRAACIKAGIKHLLRGDALTDTESLVVREYMKPQDLRELERSDAEGQAGVYADIYREKEAIFKSTAEALFGEKAKKLISGSAGRFMMFMEPGQLEHNEAIVRSLQTLQEAHELRQTGNEGVQEAAKKEGQAMKPLVMPYLEMMMNVDTSKYAAMSDEELLAENERLQELYISGMQVADIAKYKDPDDPQGRSIKEAFCGENGDMFILKCSLVQYYAVRARMLSMAAAYQKGVLTKECFIGREQEKIRLLCGLEEQDDISMNHMLTYVRDTMKKNEPSKDYTYAKYLKSEKIKEKIEILMKESFIPETTHPEYIKRLTEIEHEARSSLGKKEALDSKGLKSAYRQKQERILQIKKEMEEPDETGIRTMELRAEMESLEEQLEYLQIQAALTTSHFSMADMDGELINEAIFRSYGSIDCIPSFREMSEEEFHTMCKQLSAGYMQKETATPEEMEKYRAENVQGLLTYKRKLSEHYEMLEERFQHKLPSIEYILEHYKEMMQLFGNIQVDVNLVDHSRDMIDLTKPEDLRLFHLVRAYNAIGLYVTGIISASTLSIGDYAMASKRFYDFIENEKESFDYLSQNHEQPVPKMLETQLQELSQTVEIRRKEADQREKEVEKRMRGSYRDMLALRRRYEGMCEDEDSQEFKAVGEALEEYVGNYSNEDVARCKAHLEALQSVKGAVSRYNAAHSGESRTQKDIDRMELMQNLNAQADIKIGQLHNRIDMLQQKQEQKEQQDAALEKLESQLKADHFRQLNEEAATIFQKDLSAQRSFLVQAAIMKNYMNKYKDVSSRTMEQFQAWYGYIQKKCAALSEKFFHSIQGKGLNSSIMKNPDSLRAEYESGDYERFMGAAYQMSRLVYIEQHDLGEEKWEKLKKEQKLVEEFDNIEWKYGRQKMEHMSEEESNEWAKLYCAKKYELTNRMKDELQKMLSVIPKDISQEERERYAAYFVMQTEFGMEYYIYYNVLPSRYVILENAKVWLGMEKFYEEHPDERDYVNKIQYMVFKGYEQGKELMAGSGFQEAVTRIRLNELEKVYPNEG